MQPRLLSLLWATFLLPWSLLPASSEAPIRFDDKTIESGIDYQNLFGSPEKLYIIETTGNGAGWLDYDNDGWLDLFVANGSTLELVDAGKPGPGNRLYRNKGDGTFEDVTPGSGLEGGYWGSGVATGDYNNDGFVDLYVTTVVDENHLYRNNGDGTFADVTAEAGVGAGKRDATSAAFFDYDRDGHLDLFVIHYVKFDRTYLEQLAPHCLWKGVRVMCGPVGVPGDTNVLFHNKGDGTFEEVTEKAGLFNPELKSLGVVTADLDSDGWLDIYVASDSTTNALYRNNGDGTFEDVTLLSGTGYSQDGRTQAGMGVDAGDYDGDGFLDLFVLNFQEDDNTLYRNEQGLLFSDMTFLARLGQVSFDRLGWGTALRDFDNDGYLDLFLANGHVYPQVDSIGPPQETYAQRNQVFRNQGDGQFADASSQAGAGLEVAKVSRGAAFGDYDNDGGMDVVVININDTLTLLHNSTNNDHHWVTIRLIGSKSNRDGIGARVELKAGERIQIFDVRTTGSYASANDPRVHFGLGLNDVIDWLKVRWPSGKEQTFPNVSVDRFYVIHEETGLQPAQ